MYRSTGETNGGCGGGSGGGSTRTRAFLFEASLEGGIWVWRRFLSTVGVGVGMLHAQDLDGNLQVRQLRVSGEVIEVMTMKCEGVGPMCIVMMSVWSM